MHTNPYIAGTARTRRFRICACGSERRSCRKTSLCIELALARMHFSRVDLCQFEVGDIGRSNHFSWSLRPDLTNNACLHVTQRPGKNQESRDRLVFAIFRLALSSRSPSLLMRPVEEAEAVLQLRGASLWARSRRLGALGWLIPCVRPFCAHARSAKIVSGRSCGSRVERRLAKQHTAARARSIL